MATPTPWSRTCSPRTGADSDCGRSRAPRGGAGGLLGSPHRLWRHHPARQPRLRPMLPHLPRRAVFLSGDRDCPRRRVDRRRHRMPLLERPRLRRASRVDRPQLAAISRRLGRAAVRSPRPPLLRRHSTHRCALRTPAPPRALASRRWATCANRLTVGRDASILLASTATAD